MTTLTARRLFCRRGHELTDENVISNGKSGKILCRTCHNLRGWARRHGVPLDDLTVTDQTSAIFDALTQRSDGCWLWLGTRQVAGYGQVTIGGQLWLAHRLSYHLHVGPITDGLHVLHRCDNPPCVNPDHLFLGTPADNAQDKSRKGRVRNQSMGKTHCKRGHALAGANLGLQHSGRFCKECARLRKRARKLGYTLDDLSPEQIGRFAR